MQKFTGYEYLLIDIANNNPFNGDKEIFEDRIKWATDNLNNLEAVAGGHSWKEKPLYLKAVQALRKVQAGKPIGHLVGFDAICSGIQILSVLTGCLAGAKATGLVDQNRRADAYTDCTTVMNTHLTNHVTMPRKTVKEAMMPCVYGSRAKPKEIFGEDTQELQVFYKAMYEICPGACMLLDIFIESWNPNAYSHGWLLPDACEVTVKTMELCEARVEVDELNHSTFTYQWKENICKPQDVKNAANATHSVDAYILRSLIRRCNYDAELIQWAKARIEDLLVIRNLNNEPVEKHWLDIDENLAVMVERYEATKMADITILNILFDDTFPALETHHLKALLRIITSMLKHKPFEIITIHDDFKCHPNNMNYLRAHYRDILVELAESTVLDDILSQLYGRPCVFNKLNPNLGSLIKNANYMLS